MVYNPQFTIAEPYNKGKVSNSNGVLTGGRKEEMKVKSLDETIPKKRSIFSNC